MDIPGKTDPITGIILAGGNSARFGSDKGLVIFRGKTLLERAAAILTPFCDEVIISTNNPDHEKYGFRVVQDEVRDNGPMMGIYSALNASLTMRNLVLAVDNLRVEQNFFNYLLSRNLTSCEAAVPFLEKKYFEPLVGFYSKSIIGRMLRMIKDNNFKLPDLLENPTVIKLAVENDFPEYHPDYFSSVNNLKDLEKIAN